MKKTTSTLLITALLLSLVACSSEETPPLSENPTEVTETTPTAKSVETTTATEYTPPIEETTDYATITDIVASTREPDVSRTTPTTTRPPVDGFEPNMEVGWQSEGQGVHFSSLHGFVNMFERGRKNIVSDDGLYKIDEAVVVYDDIFLPLPLAGFALDGVGMRRVISSSYTANEPRYYAEMSFGFKKNDGSMRLDFYAAEFYRDLNEKIEEFEQLIEQGYTGIPSVRMVEQVLVTRNDFGEVCAGFFHNGRLMWLSIKFFDSTGSSIRQRQPTDKELLDLVKQIRFVSWDNRATALEAERAAFTGLASS